MTVLALRRTTAALAVATATAVGLVVGVPAYAVTPAAKLRAVSQVELSADTDACSIVGTGAAKVAGATVPTSGTRSFTAKTSSSGTAVGNVDASDTVTLNGTGTVAGTVRGSGGAFSSMTAKMSGTATITQALPDTACKPASAVTTSAAVVAHVRKRGRIVLTMSVSGGGYGGIGMQRGSGFGSGVAVVSQLRRGSYTVSYPVRPGDYSIQVAMMAVASELAPYLTLHASSAATFTATFKAS